MNSIFIVSDIDINSIYSSVTPKGIGIYKDGEGEIVQQYLDFRKKIKSGFDNTDDKEVILVYIKHFSKLSDTINQINKLLEDKTFTNDVTSLYTFEVLDDLSSKIDEKIYDEVIEQIKKLNLDKIEFFNIILSRENNYGREVELSDIYSQIERLLSIMHKSYSDIYDYLKGFKKNEHFFNSFGSASITFPNNKIKDSLFHLNNAYQLHFLLTNKKFDKDEFYQISTEIQSKNNKEEVDKLLAEKYSKNPDTIHVIDSVNGLYNDCKINEIESTFESVETFPYSNYISENSILSTSEIASNQNNYLFDVVHRTKDSISETNDFFLETETVFREYRNDKIIAIQSDLNRQRKEKISILKNHVDNFSKKLIYSDNEEINTRFGSTTSFEALSKSLNYFAFGLSEDEEEFDNDKNLVERIKKITKKNSEERAIERRRLFRKFDESNKQYKESIDEIDTELEDSDGVTGYRRLIKLRKELSLAIIDRHEGVFSKHRYSYLLLTVLFSILSSIAIFSFFYFLEILILKYSIYFAFIPIFIGLVLIAKKIVEYRNYRNHIESLIQHKIVYLDSVINNHDHLVKEYLSSIKVEYTLDILKELQDYCKIKSYKLDSFRTYLLNHYLYSINHYNQIDFDNTSFEYSLFSKIQVENLFFSYPNNLFFDSKPEKKLDFYNVYLEKSKKDFVYTYQSNLINIDFFDESEIAYDKVLPIESHRLTATYHNEYEKEPVLFLSNENSIEPIVLEDIKQGDVGNCYFMAAIGAIAHTNPMFIRKMITSFDQKDKVLDSETETQEQSYLVRFFDSNATPKYVAIDNKFWFYKDSIKPVYSDFAYSNEEKLEIWPMILEKAWAKVNKGYANIIGSNKKQRLLDFGLALSGNFIEYNTPNDFSDDEIFTVINEKIVNDIPVVVYSKETVSDESVVAYHAYTVEKVNENTINIYNPHGKNHLNNVSVAFFKDNFDTVLFFNLEETSELIIPPDEQVIYIDHIKEIEDEMTAFFGNELFDKIKKIPTSELIEKNEFKKVLKRIDNASMPLFNAENKGDVYLVLFADENISETSVFKKKPNDIKSKIDNDTYLLLTKYQLWEI